MSPVAISIIAICFPGALVADAAFAWAALRGEFTDAEQTAFLVFDDEERVVRIVLRGLSGPVTVKGQAYSGAMPAWADALSDAEIAAVLTYVRSSFGNTASAITPDAVAAQRLATASRTAPWTAAELGR